MHTTDILILYSEISVAIAGFAGIAGAIAKPKDEISKLRVQAVVTCAIPLLLFSFVTLLLLSTISSEELVWQSASLIPLIWTVGYYLTHFGDVKVIFTASNAEKLIVGLDIVVVIALALNVLVLHPWKLSSVYLVCIFSWLLQACYFFYLSIEPLWRNKTGA
jgi:hypothetical protein